NGTANGTTHIKFTSVKDTRTFFPTPIPVIVSGGGNLQATQEGLKTSGLIYYTLENNGAGSLSVRSNVDRNAVAPTLSGILGALAWIDASFHQPASALVASLQSEQPNKWSGGPWARASGGKNDVSSTGTVFQAPGVTPTAASLVRTAFTGLQVGLDSGVLN